jgi:tetratricopeptide (TPR) repeat protein
VAIDRERVQANAQKFVEKKKYDRAVAEYQKIIQEDPNDARTLLKIGDLQSKMAEFGNAIATYERVGKYYASQGFALKAIAVYKQIRELVTKHVPHLEERYGHITPLLGDLYQQLGLTSDALAALDEHATRLQRQQRDAEAIEVFRRIVDLDPPNPLPHLRLAEALSRVQDVDGAVQEFHDAAELLVKLGRRDDALKVFERLLHLRPSPTPARQCAELYLERGMTQDGMLALAKLQLCFQADPKNLETLALLARAFGAIGQANKGIEVQKEMARLAKEQGKPDLFRQLIEKLQRAAPNDEQVRALALTSPDFPAAIDPVIRDAAAGRTRGSGQFEEVSYDSVDSGDLEDADLVPATSERSPARVPAPQQDSYDAAPDVLVDGDDAALESAYAGELTEALAQLLADAMSFRRVRLYLKAVETLHAGLELDPSSRPLREALRDVLLESMRYEEAAKEMTAIASLQIQAGDVAGAIQSLHDALAIDPADARAHEMLQALGAEAEGGYAPAADAGAPRAYDVGEAPLPAYEFEDSDLGQEASTLPRHLGAHATLRTDEPFGGTADAPLPSFPLAPESEASLEVSQPRPEDPPAEPEPEAALRASGELEEALEEADFFASRGLFDDARAILHEQLGTHPNHVLLKERLSELDSQEQGARGGSGTREVPRGSAPVDRSFDIAASLDAIEHLDTTRRMPVGLEDMGKQVDVEEVFAKFKEGVAQPVPTDDTQSHYDLGVAYKEMGLVDDAIREFDAAADDPERECVCHSMIGMILLERGKASEAIDAFMRGLQATTKAPEQEVALYYEIGAAYESLKRAKDALTYFQKVARRDSNYRDVQERVRRLSKIDSKPAPFAAAVGADDEFDRAFDEIIGGGKLP